MGSEDPWLFEFSYPLALPIRSTTLILKGVFFLLGQWRRGIILYHNCQKESIEHHLDMVFPYGFPR